MKHIIATYLSIGAAAIVACAFFGSRDNASSSSSSTPTTSAAHVEPLIFWHTQSDKRAEVLQNIADRFNATHPKTPIRCEYVGSYDALLRKTLTALIAKHPPDLAVAYPNMVMQYTKYNAIVDLTPMLAADADMAADIFPSMLDDNRYEEFNDALLSLPFTKSVLLMYCNMTLLKQLGFSAPPKTWDEFLTIARAARETLRLPALSYARDASTFDGLIFSFNGNPYDPTEKRSRFDEPPTRNVLTLLRTLFEENLAIECAYGTYDDRSDFCAQRCLFFIRSSTSRPYVDMQVKNSFTWDAAPLPTARTDGATTSVLFGANICLFKSTPDRERVAWEFVRFFTSTAVTAEWSAKVGYLPVRRSSLQLPNVHAFLADNPTAQRPLDALAVARSEPKASGWSEIRYLMERASAQATTTQRDIADIARELQRRAEAILAQDR